MFEILKYSFFQNALIGGILISLILSILGVFVVMRKEANITHSISNFLFLGITISLLFNGNYYIYAFIFGIIASLLIYIIEKTNFITKESSKEIISQIGIAGAIFCIGFLGNLTLDINNLLFGNILFINHFDLIILVIFLFITLIFFKVFGKNLFSIIINEDIAKAKGINVGLYNLFFLILLSLSIGISIKIFGIMLVGAFLIIPVNSGKILGNSIKSTTIITILLSISSVIIGLFSAYFIGTNSGATIILVLILYFLLSIIFKSSFSK